MNRQAGSVTNCRKLAEGVELFDCRGKLPEGASFFDFRAKMPLTAMREVVRSAPTQNGRGPMTTSAYTRIPVIILAALALAACPGKKKPEPSVPPVQTIFYVSTSGSDTNPGTQSSQFKTITHAMTKATRSGSTVYAAVGTYDVANGETFPITVPAGVLLIGDEANKGNGGSPTRIVGGGLAPG